MKPPGYQRGTKAKHCGNCGSFKKGYCSKFKRMVGANMTCDKWWKS